MTEISDRYRRLAEEFTRRVESVPDEAWSNPSPCEGWTARDVVRHVVETEASVPTFAGGEPLPLSRDVDEDPKAAWAEIRDVIQDRLDDPEWAGTEFDGMFGRSTLADAVDSYMGFDLLIHAWDIARATGQDETLLADEVTRTYVMATQFGDNLRRDGVCGPAVEVPADASEQDRLLGLLGRTP